MRTARRRGKYLPYYYLMIEYIAPCLNPSCPHSPKRPSIARNKEEKNQNQKKTKEKFRVEKTEEKNNYPKKQR